MNTVKQVIELSGKNQKEVCEIMKIKQSTLSAQMNKETIGSIENSISIAKELNIKSFTTFKNGYKITIKLI